MIPGISEIGSAIELTFIMKNYKKQSITLHKIH